jgi:CRP/FNR family transcriptional regulator
MPARARKEATTPNGLAPALIKPDRSADQHQASPCPETGCLGCAARHIAISASLNDDELMLLEHAAQHRPFSAGSTIIHEGDAADSVFTISSGVVRQTRLLSDGRRQIMGFLFTGDFIGMTRKASYGYGAEAITDVDLCRFARRDIDALAEKFPKLRARLLDIAYDGIDAAQGQMLLLGRKTATERVATFLLDVLERQSRTEPGNATITLRMTRGDIADYLGLTIETVSRAFSRLKQAKVIAVKDVYQVAILDLPRLVSLSGDSEDG